MDPKVLLARQSSFGATRRLAIAGATPTENRAAYGKAHRLHGHGYLVEAFYAGVPGKDGMIVNVDDVKPVLARASAYFDGSYLNDLPEFQTMVPTLENIVHSYWSHLPASMGTGHLHRLRIDETPRWRAVKTVETMLVTRSYDFCAAHRLHMPHLSEEENEQRYGICNNPAGHGHNFRLDVTLRGEPDPRTGQLIPLSVLDNIVDETVIDRFDHRHLNEDCPEFADLPPTTENFAMVIFKLLDPLLETPHSRLAKIGLQETFKNYFEVER